MIHSVRFTCVLDTNVIYPIEIRDVLFWFAYEDLYTPKWSKGIFSELKRVMEKKGATQEQITHRIEQIYSAFPDAEVENYEELVANLSLPDQDDNHVLAAAIKTNANLIVTNNLKDFPNDHLAKYGLAAKSADDFLADIIDLNPQKALMAFKKLVLNRRNPDLNEFEVLDRLRNVGLTQTANYLHSLI